LLISNIPYITLTLWPGTLNKRELQKRRGLDAGDLETRR
jgi:hypothetical protein